MTSNANQEPVPKMSILKTETNELNFGGAATAQFFAFERARNELSFDVLRLKKLVQTCENELKTCSNQRGLTAQLTRGVKK